MDKLNISGASRSKFFSTTTKKWHGLVLPVGYLLYNGILYQPEEEEFEDKSQVNFNAGTITFIGKASLPDIARLLSRIEKKFENFEVKFVPQNVVVKVNCYPNIAICIKLLGSKEENAMIDFLSREHIAYQKKMEFYNKIELKVKNENDSGRNECEINQQMFIVKFNNKTMVFKVEPNATIYELKLKIKDQTEIPPNQQRILFGGAQREDERTLADYNIRPFSTLYLVKRLLGGTGSISDLAGILDCPICLGLLFAPVVLNCTHTFCQHCIGEWREESNTCPSCRKEIESENRVNLLDKILEKVESEIDKKEDKDKREEQKRKHTQFMENRPRQVRNASIEEPLVNPVIETATTEFVISNGRLAQARIQFDSGHDIIYNEGNSGFDTFRNAFNSDQDYQDFDADLQM